MCTYILLNVHESYHFQIRLIGAALCMQICEKCRYEWSFTFSFEKSKYQVQQNKTYNTTGISGMREITDFRFASGNYSNTQEPRRS